jgi:lipid-binding SYLF domain-containing protein
MAHGYGFMIKKLDQDMYGNSKWSQPLFFSVSQTGLGFSFGYQWCDSAIALLSLGSLDVFKQGITRCVAAAVVVVVVFAGVACKHARTISTAFRTHYFPQHGH